MDMRRLNLKLKYYLQEPASYPVWNRQHALWTRCPTSAELSKLLEPKYLFEEPTFSFTESLRLHLKQKYFLQEPTSHFYGTVKTKLGIDTRNCQNRHFYGTVKTKIGFDMRKRHT